jgi:hypothetical protein
MVIYFTRCILSIFNSSTTAFTADRQPWGGNTIWNMIGYVIGVFLYASLRLGFLKIVKASHSHQQIWFFIAFTIIALKLAPFA